ncbi:hypothetical protein [Curtobacterium sp. L1-20]|uniref:hypothetical protein n=1 Tax=Curtobacterium sp. L1-20 TaxID=3138181 RepID=UPI003B5265FF
MLLAIAAGLFIRSARLAIGTDGVGKAHVERGRAAPWFWGSMLLVLIALIEIVLIVVKF